MQVEKVFKHLVDSVVEYVRVNELNGVIMEVDGGINSAICALICHQAQLVGKFSFFPIVVGIHKEDDTKATEVAKTIANLCSETPRVADLYPSYRNMLEEVIKHFDIDGDTEDEGYYSVGNRQHYAQLNTAKMVKSTYLSSVAVLEKCFLLQTSCLTDISLGQEPLEIGYCSVNLLGRLWKTEVHELADFIIKRYKRLSKKNTDDGPSSLLYANIANTLRQSANLDNRGETNAPDAMLRRKGYTREIIDQVLLEFRYYETSASEIATQYGQEVVDDLRVCHANNNKMFGRGLLATNMCVPKFDTFDFRAKRYKRFIYEDTDDSPSWLFDDDTEFDDDEDTSK